MVLRVSLNAQDAHLGFSLRSENCDTAARAADLQGASPSGRAVDRKSTRLNSSHQIISYAVFCLKKKKQTVRIQAPLADPSRPATHRTFRRTYLVRSACSTAV